MNFRKTDWQAEGIEYHRIQKEKVFDNNILFYSVAGSSFLESTVGFITQNLITFYEDDEEVESVKKSGVLRSKGSLESGRNGSTPPAGRPSHSFQLAPRGVNFDQKLENAVKTMDSNQAPDFLTLSSPPGRRIWPEIPSR